VDYLEYDVKSFSNIEPVLVLGVCGILALALDLHPDIISTANELFAAYMEAMGKSFKGKSRELLIYAILLISQRGSIHRLPKSIDIFKKKMVEGDHQHFSQILSKLETFVTFNVGWNFLAASEHVGSFFDRFQKVFPTFNFKAGTIINPSDLMKIRRQTDKLYSIVNGLPSIELTGVLDSNKFIVCIYMACRTLKYDVEYPQSTEISRTTHEKIVSIIFHYLSVKKD
jgi:hypothetical protein